MPVENLRDALQNGAPLHLGAGSSQKGVVNKATAKALQEAQARIQAHTAAQATNGPTAAALPREPAAMEASLAGILRRGLSDDLNTIATRLGAGLPVPVGYAALTIAASVAAGAAVFWAVDRLGVKGPLGVGAAVVLGGLGIDIVAERLARTTVATDSYARFQARKASADNPAAPPEGAEPSAVQNQGTASQ